jgi:hypothetical protein
MQNRFKRKTLNTRNTRYQTLFMSWAIVAATMALNSSAAEVYEWRDADGVEHMTDTPPPGDQKGVVMLRIDGKDVNSADLNAGGALDAAAAIPDPSPARDQTQAQPFDEADCAEIHGRPCNWDQDWRHYAHEACNRTGAGQCDDDGHLRRDFDPRRRANESAEQHAVRHAARHAGHHR